MVVKSGLLGIAIDSALSQWPTLVVYPRGGRVEIDNNLVENAIRPTAPGKKNWLFMGDADAGERGAILHTVIESCRRRGIDPYVYLRDVLTLLPKMTNRQIVSGHSKPARDGRMKTSHFESGIAHWAAMAALMRDEPTHCEPATFNRHAGGQWLVVPEDCA